MAVELAATFGTRGNEAARWALPIRWVSGALFLAFGIGKFSERAHEVDSFASYGLPSPDVFVYAIGVLEVVGGGLLIVGLLTLDSCVLKQPSRERIQKRRWGAIHREVRPRRSFTSHGR